MLDRLRSSRPAVCTMSLGRAWIHKLPYKLDQAKRYGFEGVELFYEDLEYFTKDMYGNSSMESQILTANIVRIMCQDRGLEIICLQPFMHYEGLLDRTLHQEKVELLKGWFEICKALGTNMIVFPSSFLGKEELIDDGLKTAVADFQEIADLGAKQQPPIQFGYESLAWGTYVNKWETCWEVVKRVDRPNFGICLDTFNIAGRAFADPTSSNGKIPNAHENMALSIQRLIKQVDVEKIVFLQLADAEYMQRPIRAGHEYYDVEKPERLCWSRNCRLFYGEVERGAYLPTKEIVKALVDDMGFTGWISHEVFSRDMADTDPKTPEILARRAAISWSRMLNHMTTAINSSSNTTTNAGTTALAPASATPASSEEKSKKKEASNDVKTPSDTTTIGLSVSEIYV